MRSRRQIRLRERRRKFWQIDNPFSGQVGKPSPVTHKARTPGKIRLSRIADMPKGYCKSHQRYYTEGGDNVVQKALRLRGKIRKQSVLAHPSEQREQRGPKAPRSNYFYSTKG